MLRLCVWQKCRSLIKNNGHTIRTYASVMTMPNIIGVDFSVSINYWSPNAWTSFVSPLKWSELSNHVCTIKTKQDTQTNLLSVLGCKKRPSTIHVIYLFHWLRSIFDAMIPIFINLNRYTCRSSGWWHRDIIGGE